MRTPARCHRSHTVECANLSVGSTVWLLRKTAQEARTGHALGRKDESRAALDAVRTRSACHQHNPVGTNDGAEGRGEEPGASDKRRPSYESARHRVAAGRVDRANLNDASEGRQGVPPHCRSARTRLAQSKRGVPLWGRNSPRIHPDHGNACRLLRSQHRLQPSSCC
eukprot:247555-Prymnesium_polylepis.2